MPLLSITWECDECKQVFEEESYIRVSGEHNGTFCQKCWKNNNISERFGFLSDEEVDKAVAELDRMAEERRRIA